MYGAVRTAGAIKIVRKIKRKTEDAAELKAYPEDKKQ